MVIYMTDVEEVCYTEVPEVVIWPWQIKLKIYSKYTCEDFLSDIGGCAGLILGMSVATVIGFLDIVLQSVFKYLKNGIKSLHSFIIAAGTLLTKY